MRLAGYALITISLLLASLAATTAYAPRLSTVAASDAPLTLGAPAGRDPQQPDRPAVAPGDAAAPVTLTPDLVQRLEALNVDRVRVKEFSLGRWDEAWIFGLAMLGLVGGGLLVRRDNRVLLSPRTLDRAHAVRAPHALIADAHRGVEALLRDLGSLPHERQAPELLRRIEEIQTTALVPFVDARPSLAARHGVAGVARLMDPFAAAERQINRAWSAAADGVLPEAITSLERALASLDEVGRRLKEVGA